MKRCYSCFKEYDEQVAVCPHCGKPEIKSAAEPIFLAPGTVLSGRYILGETVGAGGFGIVYKAYDTKLETVVAVKEFFVSRLVTRAPGLKNLIVSKKAEAEFNYRKSRFLAEARNMAKFGTHRSIPNVFEYFEDNNTAYIVMELLQGCALNSYLKDCGGRIPTDFAVMIATEVGMALKSMHEQGIIHRDVAPDNVFICSGKDIRIKLMDLGAAKLTDSVEEVVDIILKPGYSPTEQYDNSKNIGPWTDIYALGATLYVMLTGIKPDESTNRKIKDTVVSPHELDPSIPENLSNSVMKAMAIDKHLRFKNVDEFLAAIAGEKKVTTLQKEKRKRKIQQIIGIAAAACLVLGAGIFGLSTYMKEKKEGTLEPAEFSVWFSVQEGSAEEQAMKAVKSHFEENFPGVVVELTAIPEEEYLERLSKAYDSGTMPTMFESTDVPSKALAESLDLSDILQSEQALQDRFLDQYLLYYGSEDGVRRIPIGIEVPMAYVITNGPARIEYEDSYFTSLDDFAGAEIAVSTEKEDLIDQNFGLGFYEDEETFLNNEKNTSAVLLGSTMDLNRVRTTITNYEKNYVYYDADEIHCAFTYEWSISPDSEENVAAAKRLLTWMLGNIYQNYLMVSENNDGQIPIDRECFDTKIQARNLSAIGAICDKFVFSED